MAQTITGILGAGASLASGVLTIDFTNGAYSSFGVNTPSSITPAQAVNVLLRRLATLTAANDDATAAIAAGTFESTAQYVASRGATATTQMMKSYEIRSYFAASDTTSDPDNLVN
jgi:hypothetical protein